MRLRVAFAHPDLGLGGAERLVVDAAVWLQEAGHSVNILTTHHDPKRCFAPTRDGTLKVSVYGRYLPARIAGKFQAACTLAKMAALAREALRLRGNFDVVFCDLTAHVVPLLKESLRAPVVFYCHYPDFLLTTVRRGLHEIYRRPINEWEARGMAAANVVLVNSAFTQAAFEQAFAGRRKETEVLFPGVHAESFQNVPPAPESGPVRLLSINRFERAKNPALAVETLARLRELLAPDEFGRLRLVMAGGFDSRLPEAAVTRESLENLVDEPGLRGQVEFALNPSDAERTRLLAGCRCLLYTPTAEHFGLVPLEAMAGARAVIAVNRGGPLETIVDQKTGFLCEPTADAFAGAAARLIQDVEAARAMGRAGREHVRRNFSRERFGKGLEAALYRAMEGGRD